MAMDADETARRVRAARHLAGLEQAELGALMKADGFGATDPGRLERPQDKNKPPPPLTPGRITSLARHTGVPERWFTEPDRKRIFGIPEADLQVQINELRTHLQQLLDGVTDDPAAELERDERSAVADRQAETTSPQTSKPNPGAASE